MNPSGKTQSHTGEAGHRSAILPALKACFPQTIPVMTGYIFLGITYGLLQVTNGFPWWLPVITALLIYTGSMEFLTTSIFVSSFNPASAFATALMVGARHLFYGISLLSKYRGTGWKKFYLIYTTSDETFAVNYSAVIPEGIDPSWYYFWGSLLDQMYWVAGALLGGVFGSFLTFNTEGLDFVMTAMFVVILMNQWLKDGTSLRTMGRDHMPELIGIASSLLCLVLFGPDSFIIPSMAMIFLALTLLRRRLEPIADAHAADAGDASGEKEVPSC